MDYKELKTKNILASLKKKTAPITEAQIKRELMWCHRNFAFSTYPYCNKNYTKKGFSKGVIKKTGTGNCIALSYGLQQRLKQKYGVKSYLIPATVPTHIEKPGYLDISHVALMIPGSQKWVFYIADPAFYFIKPIKVDFKKWKLPGTFQMSNIYSEDYDNVETYFSEIGIITQDAILNKYQTVEAKTPFVRCFTKDGETGDWNYFITEITNPDEAITSFFIKVWKDKPFITKTKVVKGRVLCKKSFHQKADGNIIIKENNRPIYFGLAKNLKAKVVKTLIKEFGEKEFTRFVINREECNHLV
tara:strand:+ start:3065 stop:3970 length:906 start_codon:yes stop_codon:yes gene_type:complete